jgi:hypothetical protein
MLHETLEVMRGSARFFERGAARHREVKLVRPGLRDGLLAILENGAFIGAFDQQGNTEGRRHEQAHASRAIDVRR